MLLELFYSPEDREATGHGNRKRTFGQDHKSTGNENNILSSVLYLTKQFLLNKGNNQNKGVSLQNGAKVLLTRNSLICRKYLNKNSGNSITKK